MYVVPSLKFPYKKRKSATEWQVKFHSSEKVDVMGEHQRERVGLDSFPHYVAEEPGAVAEIGIFSIGEEEEEISKSEK